MQWNGVLRRCSAGRLKEGGRKLAFGKENNHQMLFLLQISCASVVCLIQLGESERRSRHEGLIINRYNYTISRRANTQTQMQHFLSH